MTGEPRGWVRRLAGRVRGARRSVKIVWGTAVVLAALLAAIATVGAVGAVGGRGAAPPRALPAAKPFRLKALGHPGRIVSLADYAGRPVIVNFFASWCPPCQRETPLLARFYRSRRGQIAVIGIDANDTAGPAERFVRRAGVTYPVGVDPFPAPTATSYGVEALPQTFFLNARHRIVKHVIGGVTMKSLTAGAALAGGGRTAQAAPDSPGNSGRG